MSGLKSLSKQTLVYGLGTVLLRSVNLLLTPIITYFFAEQGNGLVASTYAFIAFLNIIFTFGMETAYFRFADKQSEQNVFSHIFIFLIANTLFWSLILWIFKPQILQMLELYNVRIFKYILVIVCLDSLSSIAFCRLRYFEKLTSFIAIKLGSVLISIGALLALIYWSKKILTLSDTIFFAFLLKPKDSVEFVFLSNGVASAFSLIAIFFVIKNFRLRFSSTYFKDIFWYALPLIIVGFGGMINETLDRILLLKYSHGSYEERLFQTGVYSAAYKLSILITLFIYAFRMGAEPFFFKKAKDKDAPQTYALIMDVFVFILGIGFLFVTLFLDQWKYFISAHKHKGFEEGLKVVPILLFANIFLGIYYNLSVAYKLKKSTLSGAVITLVGVAITLLVNMAFIPKYGYIACAWATFFCYLSMALGGFLFFKKIYYIPYHYLRIVKFLILIYGLYFAYSKVVAFFSFTSVAKILVGILFLSLYFILAFVAEKKMFQQIRLSLGKK